MQRGFLYLVAVMDWATRKVLSWQVSNTMDADFCIEALEEALARFGKPEIFNTDQGSQFTSPRFTGVLREAGVRISMAQLSHHFGFGSLRVAEFRHSVSAPLICGA